MSDDANSLFAEQGQLEARRLPWESWWQDIAERVAPSQAQITTTNAEGRKISERRFDSRAVFANERFAAVLNDLTTPRTQRYHVLTPESDNDEPSQEAKQFLERINNTLFAVRYRPAANFASQRVENCLSQGVFGNASMFIEEDLTSGPMYIAVPMRESYWACNRYGLVDRFYRKYPLGAREAVKFFEKAGAVLPEAITRAAEKEPFREFEFLHCVAPNEERVARRLDYRGMPWSSFYLCYENKKILSAGGYREWPYAIDRGTKGVNEWYARSPAMVAWGAILTLNEEKKTITRAGQLSVAPPLLLAEDGVLDGMSMKSHSLNYGALSADGIELVKPLKVGSDVPLGIELMELEGREVDEAYLASIYKALLDHPSMTATQALQLIQEKAVLLAPVGARHETEALGPMVQRELGILSRNSRYRWMVEEMPDELRDVNGAYKIESRSPLSRMLRSGDAVAISRTFEGMATAAQLDTEVAAVVDVKGAFREFAEISGMPAKYIRDEKTVEAMLRNKAEQEQAANVASVAPEFAQAALNTAKAQQIRQELT